LPSAKHHALTATTDLFQQFVIAQFSQYSTKRSLVVRCCFGATVGASRPRSQTKATREDNLGSRLLVRQGFPRRTLGKV
jgi:hypothetical protein